MQAVPQLGRHFLFASREVRSADRTDEQCVTSQNEPWRFCAPAVRDQQANAIFCVTRRMYDLNASIAGIYGLLVGHRGEREGGLADIGI